MSDYERMISLAGRLHTSGQDALCASGCRIQRLRGGMNNALYRVELLGDSAQATEKAFAVKLFVPDERRRAQRELAALQLLAQAGLDLAPAPLSFDESGRRAPYPAVVCTWLPGRTLQPPLAPADLQALLASFQAFNQLEPGEGAGASPLDLPIAWFHWLERAPYLVELDDFMSSLGGWLGQQSQHGAALQQRLAGIVAGLRRTWRRNRTPVERGAFPLRLAHVDMNLNNCIAGPDGRVRWVDWEFSGWGDPAQELCDLRWHASLVELDPQQHAWLRQQYRPPDGDPDFWGRVALWDALLLARWPFLVLRWLWSLHNGPDRLRLSQVAVREDELWRRLEWLIVRAETYLE